MNALTRWALAVVAGRGYLQLLGLSLLRGRDFEDQDGLPGKETVIVSHALAVRYFQNQDPVGKQMRLYDRDNKPRPWMTIIGVAVDPRIDRALAPLAIGVALGLIVMIFGSLTGGSFNPARSFGPAIVSGET